MSPIRINIPDQKPATISSQAGQIVMDALTEAGLDYRKCFIPGNPPKATPPMLGTLLGMWGRGEITREEFVELAHKVTWLNPALALEGGAS